MVVQINKWNGQNFDNPFVYCSVCNKIGTVKRIVVEGHVRCYCKSCLLDMVAEIDRAVLEAVADTAKGVDVVRAAVEFKENLRNESPVNFKEI